MKRIDLKEAAQLLRAQDDFLLLCHAYPDGDTLGSAAALCLALRDMGKRAYVRCGHEVPDKFLPYVGDCFQPQGTGETIVALDVADEKLLGPLQAQFGGRVELCIDHHMTHRPYAQQVCVVDAAANCENVYYVIEALGAQLTPAIADALFLGLSTDTGCFKYAGVTPQTHLIAARLIEAGANAGEINRQMFDTKTKTRTELERRVLDGMEYHFDDQCALVAITNEMRRSTGATDGDMDGISALPRMIEGVIVGITLRERTGGTYKASLRTHAPVNAAEICTRLGGGGHARAAGCELDGPLERAKEEILRVVKDALIACRD